MIVVTGSREWTDEAPVRHIIGKASVKGETHLLHGGARGLDVMAGRIARANGLDVEIKEALWDEFGRSAGFRRNLAMLDMGMDLGRGLGQPVTVLAFKQGFDHSLSRGGTEHMVKISLAAGVDVFLHDGTGWRKL